MKKYELLFILTLLFAVGIGFAAPSVSIISPSPSETEFISATSATFNVSSNETINVTNSLIIWTNQSGAVTNFSAINVNNVTNATWRTFSDLLDGTHSFQGYIISNLSDTSGAVYTAVRNITQDDTVPAVDIVVPSGNVQVGADPANISFTFDRSDTNLDRCTYNLTGGSAVAIGSCNNLTLLLASSQSGTSYTVTVVVNDSAGNSNFNTSDFTLQSALSGGGGGSTPTVVVPDIVSVPEQEGIQSESASGSPSGIRIPIISDFIDAIMNGINRLFGGNTEAVVGTSTPRDTSEIGGTRNIGIQDAPRPLFRLPKLI